MQHSTPSSFPPAALTGALPYPEPKESARTALARALLLPLRRDLSDDQRRIATLLAGLSLAHIGISLFGAMQTSLVASGMSDVLEPVLGLAACSYALAYGLARAGHVRAAAWWAVASQVIVPVMTGVALDTRAASPMSTPAWMVIALLTANAALSPRSVLLVGAIATLSAVGTLVHLDETDQAVGEAGLFLIVVTFTVVILSRHRARTERDRRAQLSARNAQLEELRATL